MGGWVGGWDVPVAGVGSSHVFAEFGDGNIQVEVKSQQSTHPPTHPPTYPSRAWALAIFSFSLEMGM